MRVGDYTFEMRPKIDEIITDKAVSYINNYATVHICPRPSLSATKLGA